MLSKIFNSARNIFNPKSQTATAEETFIEKTITEMVTTRGQRGKQASDEEFKGKEATVVDTPNSSRKRQRDAKVQEGRATVEEKIDSTPAKKQKTLPLREKDDPRPNKNTRVVVEIPVSKLPIDPQDTNNSTRTSEAVQDILEISNSESEGGNEVSEEPDKLSPTTFRSKVQKNKGRNTKSNQLNTSFASPQVSETGPSSIQPKHKRFGSEEPEAEIFSTAVERVESSEDDSDDDAPEVVGTMDALKSAMSKARNAAKVVEEKETASRKKRQERDAILKKQAALAIKKRKRAAKPEDVTESNAGTEMLKPLEGTGVGENEDVDDDVNVVEEGDTKEASLLEDTKIPMPATSAANLPDLLPDEYLQDEEPESRINLESERPRKKPKTKFGDVVEKKPKDRRVGSTTYRVSEVSSKNLAPKSSFHARSTKELWLKGRPGNSVGGSRKPFSSGFFKLKK